MKDLIVKAVKKFLEEHHQYDRPILLGFSGGTDSLALLHLLLECRRFLSLDIHLAHVDHGWRKESREQALTLAEEAKKLNLPIYLRTLKEDHRQNSNLEAVARDVRLRFFAEIYSQMNCQALLLAHQADDQAETILKKLLEGANLFSLGGMRPFSIFKGMHIWRPLLTVSKKMLTQWLKERGLVAIDDETNNDPRFLRARMRVQIFPDLSKQFGKEIANNLLRLGEAAEELKQYMQKRITNYQLDVYRGPFGIYADFSRYISLEEVELKVLIRNFLDNENMLLSDSSFLLLKNLIRSKAANRRIPVKGNWIYVDRGRVFILNRTPPTFKHKSTSLDSFHSWIEEKWKWECSICHLSYNDHKHQLLTTSWHDLWLGKGQVVLPKQQYEVVAPEHGLFYPKSKRIKEWWTANAVPAFLRQSLPVIASQKQIVHEFLTGKSIYSVSYPEELMCIKFEIKNI
jgi:tRNA(Ile)-lysidine synthase